jgi:sporadic carbohydrate cluster protein (TIGR04323 family)
MPGCFLMFEQLLNSLESLEGIVCYSLQQVPDGAAKREEIFERIILTDRSIHFAVEGLCVSDVASARRVGEIAEVQSVMPFCLSAQDLCDIFAQGNR